MPNGINLLSRTFPCAPASGIVARRVVVEDAAARGNVKLPAAGAEKTAVGVALSAASAANNVSVQVAGTAVIESDGSAVINPGDYVICDGAADGRVKSQAIAAGSANIYNVIGKCTALAQVPATAGAFVEVDLLLTIMTGA